jgi:hypothetical protein
VGLGKAYGCVLLAAPSRSLSCLGNIALGSAFGEDVSVYNQNFPAFYCILEYKRGTHNTMQMMNKSEIGKIVSIIKPDTRLLSSKTLHIFRRDLSVEILHDIRPTLVKLITRLPHKTVIL